MKRFVLASAIAGLLLGLVLGLTDMVGFYGVGNGALNAGMYVGPCVVEVKGDPGVGCYV